MFGVGPGKLSASFCQLAPSQLQVWAPSSMSRRPLVGSSAIAWPPSLAGGAMVGESLDQVVPSHAQVSLGAGVGLRGRIPPNRIRQPLTGSQPTHGSNLYCALP